MTYSKNDNCIPWLRWQKDGDQTINSWEFIPGLITSKDIDQPQGTPGQYIYFISKLRCQAYIQLISDYRKKYISKQGTICISLILEKIGC